MNQRPTVQGKNALISIEGWKPAEQADTYTVRLAYARMRSRSAKIDFKQRAFRVDTEQLSGKFTNWPKKWDAEIREKVESQLAKIISSRSHDWPEPEHPVRAIERILG